GERLDLLCIGTKPSQVDGLEEELQPPLEVCRREGLSRMDELVRPKWVSRVANRSEQGATPKGRPLRELRVPVDAGNVIEHRTEQVVLGDVTVEATHHLGDVVGIAQV